MPGVRFPVAEFLKNIIYCTQVDALAEWLRRQPAKLLGSARAGSNPAGVEFIYIYHFFILFLFCVSELLGAKVDNSNLTQCHTLFH